MLLVFQDDLKAANSISQLPSQGAASSAVSADTQAKIDELNKKAETYRKILELKQQQSATLQNQLSLMDSNIDQLNGQIDLSSRKIDEINSEILDLEGKIKQQEGMLAMQKELLSQLVQMYYVYGNESLDNALLFQDKVADLFLRRDKLSQLQGKIGSSVQSINDIRENLQSQIPLLETRKQDLVSTQVSLKEKSNTLATVMDNKQDLLSQTKGEQSRYAQLLANVEAQKEELLSIDELSIAGGLSAASFEKPSSDSFASTTWYYSQKDPAWGNQKIGNSNSYMKDYGCAVTSVAMVLASHGSAVSPGNLAKQKIFSWDLIAWPTTFSSSKIVMTADGFSHNNINWSTIDKEIVTGNPVIVYIGKTAGKGGHYVVIHHKAKNGKYVVHDPYFGSNIYLDTSRALVGKMGVDSGTRVDQMIIYK